ncbi:histidine kinase N-terminal 7TM domain-containing protein [Gorillibacterium timonense]|uniref:histidine kinase N-terminal 7TM domain-containing protein n=1 Tax=Gorillibacterium timonense TaxID=1689269 RepID=UPI00071D2830|nr:histidine kinase N-terminal 7TM domain-containing protein [Gorillibacterium timonense]
MNQTLNRTLGMVCSLGALACTVLFFAGLLFALPTLSYTVCLFLSWFYVGLASVYAHDAPDDRKAVAVAGIAIAVVYSVFTNLVYYTQLTTVAQGGADSSLLTQLTFEPGSWLFGFDILGYGLMALSTFLIGLAFMAENKRDRVLRILLLLHGAFFPICVAAPTLGIFQPDGGAAGIGGTLALMGWCLYFAPIAMLSFLHFRDSAMPAATR